MMTGILIALAAGLASATMFASIISGALMSLVLFYLAPLPLMVAALGWGSATALIGGVIAALGLGFIFGFPYTAAFALTVALPAWWLGHLTLLARPVSSDPQLANLSPALDWYPTGRILAWTALFASITTISALLTLGTDADTITGALRRGLLRIMGTRGAPSGEADRVVDALVAIAPGAATIIAMMTLTLNLWLAAKITTTSGLMKRPWPDLRTTTLPGMILIALLVAVVLCFVGGLLAMVAQIVSSALLMAYAVTGFAVLHTVTQAFSGRAFVLGAAYAATLFIGWPLLGMISLGLADAVFGIRQAYWTRRGPPPMPTT
ncbi:DUF2232 domain-containing protein [Bradyrhizobium sp. G127]|jgi:hypothetical protein|uniref:DUF2232 domain-containing protein n=1 Tax=Bradyrhizobium sp. G127 TaxID=2904800 RepID=UPI001F33317A|nr:DUF2232 domain-containing protein [Bradyrhizobium sp. G127]MCF2523343.1 YybS family protein [Bradyrhizobium sp. G127]